MCAGSGNIEVSSKSEQGVNKLADVPWKRFLNNKALWGLVAVHCSFGVGPLVCLSWLPSYYSDVSSNLVTLVFPMMQSSLSSLCLLLLLLLLCRLLVLLLPLPMPLPLPNVISSSGHVVPAALLHQ